MVGPYAPGSLAQGRTHVCTCDRAALGSGYCLLLGPGYLLVACEPPLDLEVPVLAMSIPIQSCSLDQGSPLDQGRPCSRSVRFFFVWLEFFFV
jgi:hypothetical protein